MFAENRPLKKHNETHLNNLYFQLVCIEAIDDFPRNITVLESQIDAIKQRNISETGNLASQLNFSQVMSTSNTGIDDRLVNGLVARVTEFKSLNSALSVLYVKFNDDSAGLVKR